MFLTPDYLAIAMEFATGGDMFQYVKRKKGLQARFRLSFVRNSYHFKLSQLCVGCAAARSWEELAVGMISSSVSLDWWLCSGT